MTQPESITHLLMTFSVTFTGEGQEPLVAARILADGKALDVPFHLAVGDVDPPLTLSGGMDNIHNRALYARALTDAGMSLALSVLPKVAAPVVRETAEPEVDTAPLG